MSTRRSPTQAAAGAVASLHDRDGELTKPAAADLPAASGRKPLGDLHAGTYSNTHSYVAPVAALHASIDTTRSALDTSASSCWSSSGGGLEDSHFASEAGRASNSVSRFDASNTSASTSSALGLSVGDTSMECTEGLELSTSEIGAMADAYPELAARALELANQTALDRVHIQSLQQQLQASQVWQAELEQEARSLRMERDAWQAKAEQHEGALRHTQILMACMRVEGAVPPVPSSSSSAAASGASGGGSSSSFFDREIALLRSHHRAALDAKDALLSTVASERDQAQEDLRRTREAYAHAVQQAAETRYHDAVRTSEQREKFQRLVEQQMNAQRRTADQRVAEARAIAETATSSTNTSTSTEQ